MSDDFDLYDSNVLVAASIPEHVHHRPSIARLGKNQHGKACAAHSLAEVYTTLTRPSRYGFHPADAARMVEQISRTFKIVSLTSAEYMRAVQDAAALNLAGPIIYDALLMACARKVDARKIYTHNVKHFRMVAPDLASRIVEP